VTRIEKQVVIDRPIADVVSFVRDWRNIPRYFDYIQKVQPIGDQEAGLGARLHVDLTFLGKARTSDWETVEYDGDKGRTFLTPLMGVNARKHWQFESAGASTRVNFLLDYQPKPPVLGPIVNVFVFKPRWNELCERGIQNLKRVVEAEPKST
jgi:ribosome-associated toxin RatA of RatAB toxin-antitoxin module